MPQSLARAGANDLQVMEPLIDINKHGVEVVVVVVVVIAKNEEE